MILLLELRQIYSVHDFVHTHTQGHYTGKVYMRDQKGKELIWVYISPSISVCDDHQTVIIMDTKSLIYTNMQCDDIVYSACIILYDDIVGFMLRSDIIIINI